MIPVMTHLRLKVAITKSVVGVTIAIAKVLKIILRQTLGQIVFTGQEDSMQNAFASQKEVLFPNKVVLISRTDTKGITRYANDAFVSISGYSREELIGKSHDIVRHLDMPSQAFKWLWDTLRDDRTRCGTVKNLCKNGDHYWVRTTVAPVYEHGVVTGYASVGRQASRAQIAEAKALYRQLNESEVHIESKYEAYKFWALDAAERAAVHASDYLDGSYDFWGQLFVQEYR